MEQVHGLLVITLLRKNVVNFGDDNSLSSHGNNRKNNFLVLGEGLVYHINESFGSPEKNFTIIFSKANTKCCLSLHYHGDNSYFLLMKKKSLSLKPTLKMLIFQFNFLYEEYLMDLVLLNLQKEMYMISQSNTMILINLTY